MWCFINTKTKYAQSEKSEKLWLRITGKVFLNFELLVFNADGKIQILGSVINFQEITDNTLKNCSILKFYNL